MDRVDTITKSVFLRKLFPSRFSDISRRHLLFVHYQTEWLQQVSMVCTCWYGETVRRYGPLDAAQCQKLHQYKFGWDD